MNRGQFLRDLQEQQDYVDHLRTHPGPVQFQPKLPKLDSNSALSLIRTNPKSPETHLVTLPSRQLPPLANTPPLNMLQWNSRPKTSLPTTSNPSSLPQPVLPLASLPAKSLPPPKLPPIIMVSCDYD